MARHREQGRPRPAYAESTAPHRERGGEGRDRNDDLKWPEPEGPRPERLTKDYPLGRFTADRRDPYTTFIVLRYTFGDVGGRPIPPGTNFWESPDVWVVSSAGWNVPVAGEPNRVFARIANRGMMDAPDVRVRFWWANPSLAITEANAHEIGAGQPPIMVPLIPSRSAVVVESPYPWTPVIENDGHECLLAEAGALYGDKITAPLDPVLDRHVGQKNLHVLERAPGARFSFEIGVANISTLTQRVVVQMRALSFDEVRAGLAAPTLGGQVRVRPMEQRPPLRMALAGTGEFVATPSALYPRRLLSAAQSAAGQRGKDCRPLGALQHTALLKAGELGVLRLEGAVPADARPQQAFGFEFLERMGEIVTGGYTLYVVVAGEEQSPRQEYLRT